MGPMRVVVAESAHVSRANQFKSGVAKAVTPVALTLLFGRDFIAVILGGALEFGRVVVIPVAYNESES